VLHIEKEFFRRRLINSGCHRNVRNQAPGISNTKRSLKIIATPIHVTKRHTSSLNLYIILYTGSRLVLWHFESLLPFFLAHLSSARLSSLRHHCGRYQISPLPTQQTKPLNLLKRTSLGDISVQLSGPRLPTVLLYLLLTAHTTIAIVAKFRIIWIVIVLDIRIQFCVCVFYF
jgi:hypothetical protein